MKNVFFADSEGVTCRGLKRISGVAVFGLVASVPLAGMSSPAQALKLYAQQNGNKPCSTCHSKKGLADGTMYPLTSIGKYFKKHGQLPPPSWGGGGYTPPPTPPPGGGYIPPSIPTPPPGGGYTPPMPPPGGGYIPPAPPPGGGYTPPAPPPVSSQYDGYYTGTRGYTDPGRLSPYKSCKSRYNITVTVSNGRVTFYSDGRNWTGSIDARGQIYFDKSGVRPPPIDPISIVGRLENARMHSGYCGGGYFRVFR